MSHLRDNVPWAIRGAYFQLILQLGFAAFWPASSGLVSPPIWWVVILSGLTTWALCAGVDVVRGAVLRRYGVQL